MAHKRRVFLGLCLLLATPTFSIDLAHIHRLRRQAQDDVHDDTNDDGQASPPLQGLHKKQDDGRERKGPRFSTEEFGEKIREMLNRQRPQDREDNPWERDRDRGGFGGFLNGLEELADRMPDDLSDFDVSPFLGQVKNTASQQTAQSNRCLKNPVRLMSFLSEVREAVQEFREDLMEDMKDRIEDALEDRFPETDSDDGVMGDVTEDMTEEVNSMSADTHDDHSFTDETEASDLMNSDVTEEDTTDGDGDDSMETSFAFASPLVQNVGAAGTGPTDTVSSDLDDDDDDDRDGIDMEDVFENLSEDSMECISAFMDMDDEKIMCRRLSRQSSRVFSMFVRSGVDCSDYMDDETDLDDAQQRALLDQMLTKPTGSWTAGDLRKALHLAPTVIDDDFLDNFDDDLLEENLDELGEAASRHGANPGLQLALRQRILSKDLGTLDSSTITRLGKGLLSLSEDDLDKLNPLALLEADIDDIFDDDDDDDSSEDDDSDGNDNDDDDDDDDDDEDETEGLRLAIGRRMKQAQLSGARQVGRVAHFLYDDLDFLESVDPDDLYDAAPDLLDLELNDEDAANLFRRMSQSSKFPALNQFTRQDVQRMRGVLSGMGLSQLQQLPHTVVREALDDLKDVEFGESQARELLDMYDDDELERMSATQLRGFGRLLKGLDADDIEDLDDDTASEMLDDLDDLDLNDAQKRLFAEKALKAQTAPGALKLLGLPGLANVVSIDDIDDLRDDDVVGTLNVSTRINWRASQASSILSKVKHSLGGRSLRPTDVPKLGNLARGLLLADLDDMVEREDDIDDLADVLGDQMEDLSSAQVDKVLDFIEDRHKIDDLPEIEVNANFVAQNGAFLAYMPPNQFNKLEFDDGGKKAFVALMSKMGTRKLPRAQLKFMAKELLDMMEDKAGEDRDDTDFRKLKQLGEFSLGLSSDAIEKMSANAVLQNLGMLGTLPLTRDQAQAVLDKIEEAMPDWECKGSVLASVGPLLQFAKEDTFDAICDGELASSVSLIQKRMERRRERIEERRNEGLWREDFTDTDAADDVTEDDNGRRRLVSRMITAALASSAGVSSGGRRRRAAGQLTCSVLRLMRQDVVMVDVATVTSMPHAEFRDCLEVLGNATKWADKDLGVLLQYTTKVIGQPPVWTNEIIRQTGVLSTALTPAQILTLQLTGVDALNSVGKHGRLNDEQLKAGFSRWLELKKMGNTTAVTAGEFSSMSEFVCGLTVAQIEQLPLDVFRRSLDVVGKVRSCSTQQHAAYASRALQAYSDNVLSWSPAVVADMGHLLGGLSSPSVQQLTADQIAMISPTVIASLPESTMKALTNAQLQQLSTNQVNALSQAQYNTLGATQKDILDAKATVPFSSTTTDHPPGGAAHTISWNVASVLAALLFSLWLC